MKRTVIRGEISETRHDAVPCLYVDVSSAWLSRNNHDHSYNSYHIINNRVEETASDEHMHGQYSLTLTSVDLFCHAELIVPISAFIHKLHYIMINRLLLQCSGHQLHDRYSNQCIRLTDPCVYSIYHFSVVVFQTLRSSCFDSFNRNISFFSKHRKTKPLHLLVTFSDFLSDFLLIFFMNVTNQRDIFIPKNQCSVLWFS